MTSDRVAPEDSGGVPHRPTPRFGALVLPNEPWTDLVSRFRLSVASFRLHEECVAIGRDPVEIRCSVLLGLVEGTAWTSPAQFEDVVAAWSDAGFDEFLFYDPPYARDGVQSAEPAAVDEILASSLSRLRHALP